MSISSKLEKLETDITSAYNAIDNKRGTIPQDKNTENLADAINSISGAIQYSTIEEMNADTNAQEDDLAIVYREEIQAIDETSEFDSCVFPNTVVLSSAFSDSISGSFGSTGGGFFDGMVDMSGTSFRFDGFGDTMVRVQYTSNDGITYTRTDGGEELQEFGTTIKWEQYEPWNDVIGNFMKIVGNTFDGLFKYQPYISDNLQIYDMQNSVIDNVNQTVNVAYSPEITPELLNKMLACVSDFCATLTIGNYVNVYATVSSDLKKMHFGTYWAEGIYNYNFCFYIYSYNNNYYFVDGVSNTTKRDYVLVEYDIDTCTRTDLTFTEDIKFYDSDSGGTTRYFSGMQITDKYILGDVYYTRFDIQLFRNYSISYYKTYSGGYARDRFGIQYNNYYPTKYKYFLAPTQLNATINDTVEGKIFYGENGVKIGTFSGVDTSDATAIASDILSTKTAYVDGVKLTGSMTNNGALSYTPTTSSQSIPAGYTSGGTISAVTSAIDNNIVAGNIKSGTTILGVTGNVVELNGETKTITPTTSQQVVTPSANKNAMTQVTVNAVTSSIDNNITAENIKKDVSILGVTGTYEGAGSINIVNGIIEQYKANTSTISANTFVEFINEIQLSTGQNSNEYVSAVLIDENKVFISYRYGSYLYAMVCTINDLTITAGTEVQISSSSSSYQYSSTILIDTNKVCVLYSDSYVYGIICTINGTTITKASHTRITSATTSTNYTTGILIDTGKIFITHRKDSYLYGIVCTINGTTITPGTDTQLSTESNSYYDSSLILIENNKVFVAHRGISNTLYGMVCTINGTAITAGTDTQIFNGNNSYRYSSGVLVDTNKIFLAFYALDTITSIWSLLGIVCTINGTTITTGTATQLHNQYESGIYTKALLLETNKVFLSYGVGTASLYGMVCTINGTTITPGNNYQLSTPNNATQYNAPVLIGSNKIFIAYGNKNKLLHGMICTINGTIVTSVGNIVESVSKIDGLLVTEATTSTAGDVWILNN